MGEETLTIPFWNKVEDSDLTIETKHHDDKLIVRFYTKNVNILNKKVEIDNTTNIKMERILDLANKVSDNYYGKNTEEYRNLSAELLNEINLL